MSNLGLSRSAVAGLCGIALALSACGGGTSAASSAAVVPSPSPLGPFPADLVEGLRTDVDVLYTGVTECGGTPCQVPGDVIAPGDVPGYGLDQGHAHVWQSP